MDSQNLLLAGKLVNSNYIQLASEALNSRRNLIKVLLSQRCLPESGWDDQSIESFLLELSAMDTNNFANKQGVGEREGRVFSSLVNRRHYFMSHGIGRSGDISADQPKAAGSSLMLKLTEYLVKDALKVCGFQQIEALLVLPLATGMSLSLALQTLHSSLSKEEQAKRKYVVWPRIDQKTCLKCIFTAGLTPIVVEQSRDEDSLASDVQTIEKILEEKAGEILCVLSTTSCFAPRVPDDVEKIAGLCAKHGVGYVVNNAYGAQCGKIVDRLNNAMRKGRVDYVVMSTDKNFMVPVGGAVVFSKDTSAMSRLNQNYPGRASAAPIVDVFITLLSMGRSGLVELLKKRKEMFVYLRDELSKVAAKHGERVLATKQNGISVAMTLKSFRLKKEDGEEEDDANVSRIGAVLYSKRVMGSRVIGSSSGKAKKVCEIPFKNYGSHAENYEHLPYLNAASAIGVEKDEIDAFLKKLEQVLKEARAEQEQTAKKNSSVKIAEEINKSGHEEQDNSNHEGIDDSITKNS